MEDSLKKAAVSFTAPPKRAKMGERTLFLSENAERNVPALQSRNLVRQQRMRDKKNSARVVRWLLLCFPYGLSLMWRASCRWHTGVKLAVTGFFAAILIALLAYPMPELRPRSGKVEIVGIQREVEVYGPELPDVLPDQSTYRYNASDSIVASRDGSEEVEYVYAAPGAYNYHRYECKYAYASSQALTVYEATFLGYTPCKLCRPPVYGQDTAAEADLAEDGGY